MHRANLEALREARRREAVEVGRTMWKKKRTGR